LKALSVIFPVGLLLVALAGCNPPVTDLTGPREGAEVLTVDFEQGKTLRYKFVSRAEIIRDWGATGEAAEKAGNVVDTFRESMEMVVAYMPVEVDPFGLTTIRATVESVSAKRSPRENQRAKETNDAVKTMEGKSFNITVKPSGKIEDYSQLDQLIKEAGESAFKQDSRQGRIKNPDMIDDFAASQWFLWDSVSSIEEPAKGVVAGESWHSKLSIPAPFVMIEARDVTYTLGEIRQGERGRVAVIKSEYKPAESVPQPWPVPYSGSFQVGGRFGLFRRFKVMTLRGSGTELFNIDSGTIEKSTQEYKMEVSAALLLPLPGTNPKITITQELTARLLSN